MTEIRELRKKAGLTQEEAADKCNINPTTFGSYERGDRVPPYPTMDKIRRVLGDRWGAISSATSSDHIRTVNVLHAGAGPGQATSEEEEIVLDDRLFEGSGIDFDKHSFIRVQGSSMEPYLRHGQIVAVEPTERVLGQDIYVYWRSDEEGHVVSIVQNTPNGIEIEKRGPQPSKVRWEHQEGEIFKSDEGTVRIHVLGRVLVSFASPARQISSVNEASRLGAQAAISVKS